MMALNYRRAKQIPINIPVAARFDPEWISPEFRLNNVNEYGKDKVNYALDFRKSDQSDMYFFNRYTASFKPQGEGEEKNQTFYVRKNAGVTAKEAYNLPVAVPLIRIC